MALHHRGRRSDANVNGEVVEVLLIAKQWPYVDRRTCYGTESEAAMMPLLFVCGGHVLTPYKPSGKIYLGRFFTHYDCNILYLGIFL